MPYYIATVWMTFLDDKESPRRAVVRKWATDINGFREHILTGASDARAFDVSIGPISVAKDQSPGGRRERRG